LSGIGVNTINLDHVITRIRSDSGFQENFSACVNFFRTLLLTRKPRKQFWQ